MNISDLIFTKQFNCSNIETIQKQGFMSGCKRGLKTCGYHGRDDNPYFVYTSVGSLKALLEIATEFEPTFYGECLALFPPELLVEL